ncbi:MAG: ROK family protein, partial [Thermoguttaceae bacterium]|nr:ROK family protein [Thermoguttaceae bacterium]
MFVGIEIGGTKLQVGVGRGDGGPMDDLCRAEVAPGSSAEAIRRQVERLGKELLVRHKVRGVGIGFGGPVDSAAGRTITSHQV